MVLNAKNLIKLDLNELKGLVDLVEDQHGIDAYHKHIELSPNELENCNIETLIKVIAETLKFYGTSVEY